MNSDVHPAVVAVVLFLTVVALAIWTAGSGAAAAIGGPAELLTGPDGRHYVQIQNQLVEHDGDGTYRATHDLGNLDVEVLLGGIAFFADGDVLLRRGPDPRSFLDNLRAFQRRTNANPLMPETPGSGLYRCNLASLECAQFGSPGIDFKAAFGLYIDPATDEVYVADTTRHLLRKYSPDGRELAQPAAGFHFPNQVRLHAGQLLVADTNNHVVRAVDPQTATFGALLLSHDVVPPAAQTAGRRWPSHFVRIGEEWWVNVMKTAMDQGGLYVFDAQWKFLRAVGLPSQADPIAVLPVGDEVWVSDWNNDRVLRLTRAGERLPDLESEGLETILAASRLERQRYRLYGYLGIALVVFILLALLVRGLAVGMNRTSGTEAGARRDTAAATEPADSEPLYLEPDPGLLRRLSLVIGLFSILLLGSIALIAAMLASSDEPDVGAALLAPLAGMLLVVVMMAWVHRANHGTSIRVAGGMLTLRDHAGRTSTSPIRDVRYDDTSIATQDAVVILGRPAARIYSDDAISGKLLPRLADARKVSAMEMIKIHVQLRHPQGVVALIALAAAFICGAALVTGQV